MIVVYALMLGLCAVISVAALQVSFNIYDGKLYEKSLQELDFFTQEVNRSLDEVEGLSYRIALSPSIQDQLSRMQEMKGRPADYAYGAYELRDLLTQELINNASMVTNIMYTDGGQLKFVVGTSAGTIGEELYNQLLGRFHEAKGAAVMQQPTPAYPYLLMGRDIRKYQDASLEYLGSLLFTYDVAGMLEKNVAGLEAQSAALCVYSDEGVIYEKEKGMMEWIPKPGTDSGYQVISGQGQKYFMCYLKSSKTGWTYVNVFPYSEIYGQNQALRYLMIGGFLVLFLVSALILKKLVHRIIKPLEQLTESMQTAGTGDFAAARSLLEMRPAGDEIGLITQEFQKSLDRIDRLIHENYEKQLLLKDTKYKMLQAQINPHFLYNTLNSIHWMIRAGKNTEAAEMTVALGTILRAALSGQPYVTIEEELDSLKKYMKIQKYRYGARIVFSLDCQAQEKWLIPHMTLQPLVENAIYHGAEQTLEVCRISVDLKEEESHIFLSVSDNGPGMTEEELKAVRAFKAKPKGHGIGLKNIDERLRMAFGEDMEFQIDSRWKEGTTVTIRIPKVEVMKGNDSGNFGG